MNKTVYRITWFKTPEQKARDKEPYTISRFDLMLLCSCAFVSVLLTIIIYYS